MKYFILLIFFYFTTNAQVTYTKTAKINNLHTKKYDSLRNYLEKDVLLYKGQTLILKQRRESERKRGYKNFLKYFGGSILEVDHIYMLDLKNFSSNYDSLVNKSFFVHNVFASENRDNIYYLELVNLYNKDTLYYYYNTGSDLLFNFVVEGYYKKMKKMYCGKKYYIFDIAFLDSISIDTGEKIDLYNNEVWNIEDITIDEIYSTECFIVSNIKGYKTLVPVEYFNSKNEKKSLSIEEYVLLKSKFGLNKVNDIIDNKVSIGMTKELCMMSWGAPQSESESISENLGKLSIWYYPNNTLTFLNGILKDISTTK